MLQLTISLNFSIKENCYPEIPKRYVLDSTDKLSQQQIDQWRLSATEPGCCFMIRYISLYYMIKLHLTLCK